MGLKDLQEIEATLKSLVYGHTAVVIDLTCLDFMFSMCLRSRIMCAQIVQSKNGRLALYADSDNILTVLKASGVPSLMPVLRTREEAVAAVLIPSDD